MTRMSTMETIDRKINEAEEKVAKTKKRYYAAKKELRELKAQREELHKEELVNTFVKSSRSYDEVMEFLKEGSVAADQSAEGHL